MRVVFGQLFVALASMAAVGTVIGAEPKVQRDVAYLDSKHARQTLDVYTPADRSKSPVLFWIHGGGWQAGDKKDVDLKPQVLTDRGYVFVSVNYRLLGDGVTIDQMAEDLAGAMRWVIDNAKLIGADADRIVVSGHSAGAQLAALICTDDRYLTKRNVPLRSIRGCVPVDGDTYDVPLQIATVEERRSTIYKKKFGDEASQKNLSPVTHAVKGKTIPPFLILHVAGHPEVTMQSEKLAKALNSAGHSAKLHSAVGKNHTTINSELGKPDDPPSKAVSEFLKEVAPPAR